MKNNFISDYWSRTYLGRKMITSENVSDSDLLFLIPNNVKRKYGIKPTRTVGRRKSAKKRLKKRIIESFYLFDLISEIVEELLPQQMDNEFFGQFVEAKSSILGDVRSEGFKNEF